MCPECGHRNHVGMLKCFDKACDCAFRGYPVPTQLVLNCTACGRVVGTAPHDCFAGWGEAMLQMRVERYRS